MDSTQYKCVKCEKFFSEDDLDLDEDASEKFDEDNPICPACVKDDGISGSCDECEKNPATEWLGSRKLCDECFYKLND